MSNLSEIYTPKQEEVFRFAVNNDYFMLINSGAKRAGKTIINNDLFLYEVKRIKEIASKQGIKEPQYILAGASLGSLYRNVLMELSNKYNMEFKMDKYNRFKLFGVQVCCFGHSKINDIGRIRGMTAFGAYINEASVSNQEVFNEIKSRCSGDGARFLTDTNPDHPSHWLKKDYIDVEDGKVIKVFHFELDDNTFLTDRYINNIKRSTPAGMFYDRDIKGLWVAGEGIIYSMFKPYMVINKLEPGVKIVKKWIGVDYGQSNATVFLLCGLGSDNKLYVLDEYFHSGRESAIQKSPSGYSKDYFKWLLKNGVSDEEGNRYPVRKEYTFIDPSAKGFILQLHEDGERQVRRADNAVLRGIELTSSVISCDMFRVLSHCKNTISELNSYSWNPASQMKGVDEPLQVNDHVMDALRYVVNGTRQIWQRLVVMESDKG